MKLPCFPKVGKVTGRLPEKRNSLAAGYCFESFLSAEELLDFSFAIRQHNG